MTAPKTMKEREKYKSTPSSARIYKHKVGNTDNAGYHRERELSVFRLFTLHSQAP